MMLYFFRKRHMLENFLFFFSKLALNDKFPMHWQDDFYSLQFTPIGPLHDPVTWYKITHAGEQVAHWDFQNSATRTSPPGPAFVLEVPLRNLLTSMCDFVPCDRIVQRAYSPLLKSTIVRTASGKVRQANVLASKFFHYVLGCPYLLFRVINFLRQAASLTWHTQVYITLFS